MSERSQSRAVEVVEGCDLGGGRSIHASARDAARSAALHRLHGWFGRSRRPGGDPNGSDRMVRPGHEGPLNRILDVVDTAKFWAVLAVLLTFLVLAYAYGHNRAQASRNAEIIQQQQEQLTYLCETVSVLDAITTQQLRITQTTLKRTDVPLWARVYLAERGDILSTTHAELANTRGCRKIE